MKIIEILSRSLVNRGHNKAHVSPALEGLCGIIDGYNERIERLEKISQRHTRQIHDIKTGDKA